MKIADNWSKNISSKIYIFVCENGEPISITVEEWVRKDLDSKNTLASVILSEDKEVRYYVYKDDRSYIAHTGQVISIEDGKRMADEYLVEMGFTLLLDKHISIK